MGPFLCSDILKINLETNFLEECADRAVRFGRTRSALAQVDVRSGAERLRHPRRGDGALFLPAAPGLGVGTARSSSHSNPKRRRVRASRRTGAADPAPEMTGSTGGHVLPPHAKGGPADGCPGSEAE